jgi:transposase
VRTLVHRSNTEGADALGDRRRHNAGHQPLLDPVQQTALREALGGVAPDGGVWTCRWVAVWMGQVLDRAVTPQRAWAWMRRLGFTPQRPRPRETRADATMQDAWQKGGLPGSTRP